MKSKTQQINLAPVARLSHMTVHEATRLDWKVVMKALEEAQKCIGGRQSWLDAPIEIARGYANSAYPKYQMHVFPTSFQAVDNYIVWREAGKVLLGKKKKEKGWRFPGGFVDPKDSCLSDAAARERREECHIDMECSRPEYVTSFRVPDPRYAGSPDKIMSAIFKSYYLWGKPQAGDDLQQVRWFTKDYLRRSYKKMIEPCHHPLVELLIQVGEL